MPFWNDISWEIFLFKGSFLVYLLSLTAADIFFHDYACILDTEACFMLIAAVSRLLGASAWSEMTVPSQSYNDTNLSGTNMPLLAAG